MPDAWIDRRDLGAGVALAVLLAGPALWRGELIGSAAAEVYGHAWVQWWAAEQWPAWPTGTALAEGTASWPVIDPLPTWLLAGLAHLIGAKGAWDLWIVVGIVLLAVGGGALARAMGGRGLVGAVGAATMPIWLGSVTSGLTEDVALGLVALALAAMLRDRPVRGAMLLGLSAWCGLYLAWLGAWAAVAIGAWRIVRVQPGIRRYVRALRRWRLEHDEGTLPPLPPHGRPRDWAFAGLIAAVLAGGAAAPFHDRLGGVGHHAGSVPARPEPLWRLDPWRGADLASFGAPGKVDIGDAFVREHPVYMGYTTLALALIGGAHPAWLGVLACAAVAPGEHLSWAGQPLGVDNPALTIFRWLPFAERFNHHARVMLLGQLLLVGLASRGAARIQRRLVLGRSPGTLQERLFALAILVEVAFLSPARVPLPDRKSTRLNSSHSSVSRMPSSA